MTDSPTQRASAGEGAHLVLYDGVCGLCSSLLQFLLTHDRRGVFAFASLQSATGRAVVERSRRRSRRPDVVLRFGELSDGSQPDTAPGAKQRSSSRASLGGRGRRRSIARVLPGAVLDRAYDVIARNRYRVFGRFEQCLAPASGVPRPIHRVNRESHMKIVIPGGSGQVGTILARAFHHDGHDIAVLSRHPQPAVAGRRVGWRDPRQLATRD